MTRARIALVAALLGVVALAVWVAPHVEWDEVQIPMPWRGEALRNPFYAAQRLVEALDATSEQRQMLGDLGTDAVIVLSNWGWDVSPSRRRDFERWVEAGGRLVVDNTLITGSDVFEKWSGVERVYPPVDPDEARKRREARRPDHEHRCPEIREPDSRAAPGVRGETYAMCGFEDFDWLSATRASSWQLRSDAGPQVIRVPRGRGSVTVVNATPFHYGRLLEGDHAALLVAALQLHSGDHVVFMSEDHYDSLLVLAWRFGAPAVVLFLAFVALALWRGSQRFGPLAAETVTARRSLAEQICGTGRFTVRWGGGAALHAASVRALAEVASRRVARYEALPSDAQVAAIAGLTAVDAAELARAMKYSADGSFELRRAVALLETARRHLLGGH